MQENVSIYWSERDSLCPLAGREISLIVYVQGGEESKQKESLDTRPSPS